MRREAGGAGRSWRKISKASSNCVSVFDKRGKIVGKYRFPGQSVRG